MRYGTGAEVLRDLDFRLAKGGFYFLTGPSGAGKTSLLQLLYLARRPSRGRIQLFGQDLTDAPRDMLPDYRRRIGVVFQDFRLIRHLSAFDNVALPLRISGRSDAEIEGPAILEQMDATTVLEPGDRARSDRRCRVAPRT